MQIDDTITDLVTEIEYIIGKECYNPKSTTWKSENCVEVGRKFRYSVHYKHPDFDLEWDTKSKVSGILPEDVKTMKYHFGANQLLIGRAIINVLEMLEKRYSLDFNALEKQIQDKAE